MVFALVFLVILKIQAPMQIATEVRNWDWITLEAVCMQYFQKGQKEDILEAVALLEYFCLFVITEKILYGKNF